MSTKYIQIDMHGQHVYFDITERLGGGQIADVFAVDMFNVNLEPIYTNETGESVACIKASWLDEDDVKFDRNEYNIGTLLAKEKIAPDVYGYFVTKDNEIKNKIIKTFKQFDEYDNSRKKNREILRIIFMQKIIGHTLGFANDNELPVTKSQKAKVCQKINHMHKLGIIHNDIHEDNIFLDTDTKEPYIIDFGYSQIIEPNDGSKSNFMNNISENMQNQVRFRTLTNL